MTMNELIREHIRRIDAATTIFNALSPYRHRDRACTWYVQEIGLINAWCLKELEHIEHEQTGVDGTEEQQ